jgi:hypothetical protein
MEGEKFTHAIKHSSGKKNTVAAESGLRCHVLNEGRTDFDVLLPIYMSPCSSSLNSINNSLHTKNGAVR